MHPGFTGKIVLGLGLALALGCRPPGLDPKLVTGWLDSKTEPVAMDVSGDWESVASYMAGGWGSGAWVQKGNQVTGSLGPYLLDGRVAGNKLYAMIQSGERIYYTAVLEFTGNGRLAGMAYPKDLADAEHPSLENRAPILLVRPAKP